jgi:hypothetical protein
MEKKQMIQAFADLLDKNCKDKEELEYVIRAITESNSYMIEIGSYRHELVQDSRVMECVIKDHHGEELADQFKILSYNFIEGMLISRQNNEGLGLLCEMDKEIQAIL